MEDNTTKSCSCPFCGGDFTPDAGETSDEFIAKKIIGLFSEIQKEREEPIETCPRCGNQDMKPLLEDNMISAAGIYICGKCGEDEAANGEDMPLIGWYIVQAMINSVAKEIENEQK